MSRDITDNIDDLCEEAVGHRNWEFADSDLHKTVETIMSKRNSDSGRIEHIVIFYKEPYEEETA